MTTCTKDFPDIGFYVVATPEEYHVEYKIYTVAGREFDGTDYTIPVFRNETTTPEHAEVFAHGFVKWDGCSNWDFDACQCLMIHACSRKNLTNIGEVLARCWDWTAELLPTWDKDVAE